MLLMFAIQKKLNGMTDSDLKVLSEEYIKTQHSLYYQESMKKNNFSMFLVKNSIVVIMKYIKVALYFGNGILPMDKINCVIDDAEKIYSTFPEKIQKSLKIEMENLRKLRTAKGVHTFIMPMLNEGSITINIQDIDKKLLS